MSCTDVRVIPLVFFMFVLLLLIDNKSVSLQDSVDGGQTWFFINTFFIKVMMDRDSAGKRIFRFWGIPLDQLGTRMNDFPFKAATDFCRLALWLCRFVQIPCWITRTPSLNPFINPRPCSDKNSLNFRNSIAFGKKLRTMKSKLYFIFGCFTFLHIVYLQ
jgi:hypothetical protein